MLRTRKDGADYEDVTYEVPFCLGKTEALVFPKDRKRGLEYVRY